ncbi:MAG TPA: autotransporter domain-containing protein [Cyclobacteriaceae bacterium]|nr:autotransporter domain-containing protein [Cyclobacteriaceae bacterium]HPW60825.1 autotransporter domain-containing protein [Cyclobacteriaceae bacterium]
MKKLLFVLIYVGIAFYSLAQNQISRIEMEIDPIAYVLKGYSLHGIYVKDRIRTDLGVFGIMQPEGYGGNDGFQVRSQGFGLKVNYLLNEKETWFGGIGTGYTNNTIKLKESSETQKQNAVSMGVHLGYRWFAFKNTDNAWKNLYIAPWFSVDYNHPLKEVNFIGGEYKQKAISFFPTIHIGYKLKFGKRNYE